MIIELAILIIVILIVGFVFKHIKKILVFILNSFVGFLALFGFNSVFDTQIAINIWSVLVVGIGGSLGFIIVLILHFLGILF